MTMKVDMLFHYSSNSQEVSPDAIRTAGWSEGWYTDADIDQARVNMDFLCKARASFCPVNVSIVGQRYRVVGGGSTTDNKRYPGTAALPGDYPSLAVLASCQAVGAPNVRRFELRGMADGRILDGEFVPSSQYIAGFDWYGRLLAKDGWKFKGRVLTNEKVEIISISNAGALQLLSPLDVAPNDVVRLLNVKGEDGRNHSGVYRVGVVTNPNQWSIINWQGGDTEGGFVRFEATNFYAVKSGSLTRGRIVTRKVGRAFFQFRGRASRRG